MEDRFELKLSQLSGEWKAFAIVGQRFERKVKAQDREDIRQAIIVDLAEAKAKNGSQALSEALMYRIASFVVADYWRKLLETPVKVCLINGEAQRVNHKDCSYEHKPDRCSRCAYVGRRPIQSLDLELEDSEGNITSLIDTIADDSAIDLEAWLDAKTWLLGCPARLIEVAYKRNKGILLDGKDQDYLDHWRIKEQPKLL